VANREPRTITRGVRVGFKVLLSALACGLAAAPAASADLVVPRSAAAFRDSVGVVTHAGFGDTAYADWPRLVAKLDELGVRHLRDGAYANPAAHRREWNEHYYQAVDLAADRGMRFTFGFAGPAYDAGTMDELLAVVGGRLRRAAEAIEAPNEYDKFMGGPRWSSVLSSYSRLLYRRVNADPSLRSLPVLGPSLAGPGAEAQLGNQSAFLDRGNIHPYAGGQTPSPAHLRAEFADAQIVAGNKPVWATEAGYHNAVHTTSGHPGVSESAAAVYITRTFLEHFADGIDRTFVYELIDEKPEPRRRDLEQHFGLLRHDFSAKPAFTAVKHLLDSVGTGSGQLRPRPLSLSVSGARHQIRRLVLQRADGTYVVALWRLASVWDPQRRRALRVGPDSLRIGLPDAARVTVTDPVTSARARPLRLRRGHARVALAGRPLLLSVTPRD
jgi:hypothetical protein